MLGELVAFALAFPVQVGLHAEQARETDWLSEQL